MEKSLSGRQEPENQQSSLVKESITARKRRARVFQRVISGLEKGGNLRAVTLTTSREELNEHFQRDFRKLQMRLARKKLVKDYIRVPEITHSGLRHEHIIFRGSYIEQAFLSKLWQEIHNSPVVYIQRLRNKRKIASYYAKYVSKETHFRISWSWGWVWKGFVKSWLNLKRYSREVHWSFHELLLTWRYCVKLNIKPEEVIGEI